MPRRKSTRNLYFRKGSWYGRKTIAGRDFKFALHTSDADTAAVRFKEHVERLTTRVRYGASWTTWEDAVADWTANYLRDRGIGPATAKRYGVSLGQIEPHLAGKLVDASADGHNGGIDAALVSSIVAKRREAGVSTATIRRDLGAAASVLTWCQQEGLRADNPFLDRLRLLRERRDPIVLPDPAHVEQVIARAPGLMAMLIRAAWVTGCRQSELVNAKRSALDLKRRELTVVGKGNKLRVIDLEPFGGSALFGSLLPFVGSPFLFWHGQGKPYRNLASRFAFLVRQVAEREVMPNNPYGQHKTQPFRPFRFHDLRHLHAVEWLRSGRSIYDLQMRLGHASITVTEGYLKFLTPEQERAVKAARGG